MINYLQLGRNLIRFAPRVKAKTSTFVYDAKGIHAFKQKSPELSEALTNTYRGINDPILEISVCKSKHDIGLITVKDGKESLSQDSFVIYAGEIEDFLPDTSGCIKTFEYDKEGIIQISKQNSLLKKLIPEFIKGIAKPKLKLTIADKNKYSLCKIDLKNGNDDVINGFYSKSNNCEKYHEKIHFNSKEEMIRACGNTHIKTVKCSQRLSKKLIKRLWMLDERTKMIMKMKFGIDRVPMRTKEVAKKLNLSGARIRDIINKTKEMMENANTYVQELHSNLDELGHILSDKERYDIYHNKSSIDINNAEKKIIIHNLRFRQ